MSQNKKNRSGIVYSTSDDFDYQYSNASTEAETLPPNQQKLRIQLDKKQRMGKQVTLVTGFVGKDADIQTLCKLLKNKCGVGGSAKDGEIIIQGDLKTKVSDVLTKEGYTVRII